ncbi:hypothetical protein ACE1ET_14900 [Saccharicrinis sp. FJH62]|uniref:hypothetical protein n=1 Tax=Saccharicrinis sp. FJH62 TaxID=3344657 RepID=UPI0035D40D9D
MKKLLFYLLLIIINYNSLLSQDKIITKTGEEFECKVLKVDDGNLRFMIYSNQLLINMSLNAEKISEIIVDGIQMDLEEFINYKNRIGREIIELNQYVKNRELFYVDEENHIIKANSNLIYKSVAFGQPYISMDGKKIRMNEIRFFSDGRGLYANVSMMGYSGGNGFAKRTSSGKINLYEKTSTPGLIQTNNYVYNNGKFSSQPGFGASFGGTNHFTYYNIGLGNLKKTKYRSLKFDMSDNEKSMVYINELKNLNSTSTFIYILSGALIVGSFTTLPLATKDINKFPVFNVVGIGVGMVCLGFSWPIYYKKKEVINKAFEAYNK